MYPVNGMGYVYFLNAIQLSILPIDRFLGSKGFSWIYWVYIFLKGKFLKTLGFPGAVADLRLLPTCAKRSLSESHVVQWHGEVDVRRSLRGDDAQCLQVAKLNGSAVLRHRFRCFTQGTSCLLLAIGGDYLFTWRASIFVFTGSSGNSLSVDTVVSCHLSLSLAICLCFLRHGALHLKWQTNVFAESKIQYSSMEY